MSSYSVKINDELFLLCSLDFLEHLEGIPALSRLQMDSIADGLRSAVDLAISNLVDRDQLVPSEQLEQVGWWVYDEFSAEYRNVDVDGANYFADRGEFVDDLEPCVPVYRRKEAEK